MRNIETMLINSKSPQHRFMIKTFFTTSVQLQLLPDAMKGSPTKIKEVTRIRTICDIQPGVKNSEVHKVLRIYYTIPVTTASARIYQHVFKELNDSA